MRILKIGNPSYYRELSDLGHTVRSIVDAGHPRYPQDRQFDFFSDMPGTGSFIKSQIADFQPDFILLNDSSLPHVHLGLEDSPVPTIWYAIDSHLHKWHRFYATIFDTVFVAQKNQVEPTLRYNINSHWLPPAFLKESAPLVPWNERNIPLSFVGTLDKSRNPKRLELFGRLAELGISIEIHKGDYIPVYTRSKIVLNQSVNDDLNYRFFEAAACGALVLTNELSHSQSDILVPGKEYLTYKTGDPVDCAQKIHWAMTHDDQIASMASIASEKILSAHCSIHRAETMIKKMGEITHRKKCTPLDIAMLALAMHQCSLIEFPARLTRFFSDRATELARSSINDPDARPWSLLILANQNIIKQDPTQALAFLSEIIVPPDQPDFKELYNYLSPLKKFLP